jgi:transcription elongation GreA/GreB family factor
VISYESDLAKDLIGRKPGESVSLSGESWAIEKIEPFR